MSRFGEKVTLRWISRSDHRGLGIEQDIDEGRIRTDFFCKYASAMCERGQRTEKSGNLEQ